jgi:ABC-type enterochelin transport system permease subunit
VRQVALGTPGRLPPLVLGMTRRVATVALGMPGLVSLVDVVMIGLVPPFGVVFPNWRFPVPGGSRRTLAHLAHPSAPFVTLVERAQVRRCRGCHRLNRPET